MKIISPLAATILFLANSCLLAETPDSLSFEIHFDYSHYIYGQSIWYTAVLKNVSDRPLTIASPILPPSTVQIEDSAGNSLRGDYMHIRTQVVKLLPGDSLLYRREVCESYQAYSPLQHQDTDWLKLGRTLLRAVYSRGLVSGFEELHIDSIPDTEKVHFRLLSWSVRNFYDKGKWNDVADTLDKLIGTGNSSAYLPDAYRLLLRLYIFERNENNTVQTAETLLRTFPDHPYCEMAIDNLVSRKSDSQREGFLKEMIAKYRPQRASIYAKSLFVQGKIR